MQPLRLLLCLEEMLGDRTLPAPSFHVRSRRSEVFFDATRAGRLEDVAIALHELVASGVTPPPVIHAKCRYCSVRDARLPDLIADPESATVVPPVRCLPVLTPLTRRPPAARGHPAQHPVRGDAWAPA